MIYCCNACKINIIWQQNKIIENKKNILQENKMLQNKKNIIWQ